jgi:hypothetical protein
MKQGTICLRVREPVARRELPGWPIKFAIWAVCVAELLALARMAHGQNYLGNLSANPYSPNSFSKRLWRGQLPLEPKQPQ